MVFLQLVMFLVAYDTVYHHYGTCIPYGQFSCCNLNRFIVLRPFREFLLVKVKCFVC